MIITEERKREIFAELADKLKSFPDGALAWDFHCNVSSETKQVILSEAKRRGIDLCLIPQLRKDGPFVPRAKYFAPPCNRTCCEVLTEMLLNGGQ